MLSASKNAHNTCPYRHSGDNNLMCDAEVGVFETGTSTSNVWMSDCDSDDFETELTKAEAMRDEGRRLGTFTRWPPSSYQTPARLAEAGFFYMGNLDRVKCAFCLGVLKKWQPNDIPFVEHGKHFPHCRFIQGDDVGNIPIGQAGIEQVLGASQHSVYSTLNVNVKKERSEKSESTFQVNEYPQSSRHDFTAITENSRGPGVSHLGQCQVQLRRNKFPALEPLQIPSRDQPVPSSNVHHHRDFSQCVKVPHPHSTKASEGKVSATDYTFEANRLATFLRWPVDSPLQPEDVARAGFYFVPTEAKPDRVKCGYCGGKLYGWQQGDDPMVEHSRCFPECPYVKMSGNEAQLSARTFNTRYANTTPKNVPAVPSSSSKNVQSTTEYNTVLNENESAKNPLVPPRHTKLPESTLTHVPESTLTHVPESTLTRQDNLTVIMRSDSVLQVLAMGFPKEKLERIVRQRANEGPLSVEELVEAALK